MRFRRYFYRCRPTRRRGREPEFGGPRAVVAANHNGSSTGASADATARVPPNLVEHGAFLHTFAQERPQKREGHAPWWPHQTYGANSKVTVWPAWVTSHSSGVVLDVQYFRGIFWTSLNVISPGVSGVPPTSTIGGVTVTL